MGAGSQYGGMYLHADWLAVGSWQLQTLGTKTWFICARSEDPFIGDDDYVDGHSPNLEESPEFAVASCYNGTVRKAIVVLYNLDLQYPACSYIQGNIFIIRVGTGIKRCIRLNQARKLL